MFSVRKRSMTLPLPKTLLTMVVACVILFPATVKAQGPRDYLGTPVNVSLIFLDFLNSNTETVSQSETSLPNNVAVGRVGAASILYSFPVGNRYGGVVASGNYICVKSITALVKMSACGFGDPSITFHLNIFGLPALRKEQFAQAIPRSFASFHIPVILPLGSYDRNSPVNTGANRWVFNPNVNLSITPDKGVSWIEFYAGARFYTDNHAFRGNNQLSQNPLVTLSAFYSHNIGKRWFAGIGANYDYGGNTYINNFSQDNFANGFRPNVTISRARTIWKFALTLRYELTATTPRAAPTNSTFLIRVSGRLF